MQYSEEVKGTLWNLIDEMSSDLSEFTVIPDKDFTRKKKWDFPTLIKFIISMESQSLKNELHSHPEIYRRFRNKDSFEFLDLDAHAYYNLNLRVLRFPISETEYECVLTNLQVEDFSAEEINTLSKKYGHA